MREKVRTKHQDIMQVSIASVWCVETIFVTVEHIIFEKHNIPMGLDTRNT
jgi:hypothetical protein